MENICKTDLASRIRFSLTEAEGIASCVSGEILRYGGIGKTQLCVDVPDDICVFSIDTLTIELEEAIERGGQTKHLKDRLLGIEPIMDLNVDMLVLSPSDCKAIEQRGMFGQSVFRAGLSFGKNASLIAVSPVLPDDHSRTGFGMKPSSGSRRLCTYKKDQIYLAAFSGSNYRLQKKLILTVDQLYITKEYLGLFLREDYKKLNAHSNLDHTDLQIDEKFVYKLHSSNRLVHINRVAQKTWGRTYLEEERYPTNKEVAKLIQDSSFQNITTTNARDAAILIRPAYANGTPQLEVQINRQGYMTNEFKALIAASDKFYGGMNLKDRKNYPKNRVVELWLKTEHGFKPYLAEFGALIIRPEIG